MALYVVATPIGNDKDLSERAKQVLTTVSTLVGEEKREIEIRLKRWNITNKKIELLNEHSKKRDLEDLLAIAKREDMALMTDCGTPGFCDPGHQLVELCRRAHISVIPVPGASSLMTLLSVVSQRVDRFYFAGFLPANSEKRSAEFKRLSRSQDVVILMDTPYRLQKTLQEVKGFFGERRVLIGLDLTTDREKIFECQAPDINLNQLPEKAEFIILIYS